MPGLNIAQNRTVIGSVGFAGLKCSFRGPHFLQLTKFKSIYRTISNKYQVEKYCKIL